jgi:hypothetical protein
MWDLRLLECTMQLGNWHELRECAVNLAGGTEAGLWTTAQSRDQFLPYFVKALVCDAAGDAEAALSAFMSAAQQQSVTAVSSGSSDQQYVKKKDWLEEHLPLQVAQVSTTSLL